MTARLLTPGAATPAEHAARRGTAWEGDGDERQEYRYLPTLPDIIGGCVIALLAAGVFLVLS